MVKLTLGPWPHSLCLDHSFAHLCVAVLIIIVMLCRSCGDLPKVAASTASPSTRTADEDRDLHAASGEGDQRKNPNSRSEFVLHSEL